MRHLIRWPAVGLVALLTCCSGTGKPAASPSPTNDASRARLLVLTHADLPDGWTSSPHRTDAVSAREDRRLATCSGAPDPATSQSADVFGDVFGQGAQTITSEAVFLRTSADAAKAIAAIKGPRAIGCAKAAARPVVAEQLRLQGVSATIRSIAVTRRTLAVKGVVSGFRIRVNLIASGTSLAVVQDVVILASGRAQVRVTFVDVGVAFPAAFELSLVKKISGKLFRS
jgi:hypothetical protein